MRRITKWIPLAFFLGFVLGLYWVFSSIGLAGRPGPTGTTRPNENLQAQIDDLHNHIAELTMKVNSLENATERQWLLINSLGALQQQQQIAHLELTQLVFAIDDWIKDNFFNFNGPTEMGAAP